MNDESKKPDGFFTPRSPRHGMLHEDLQRSDETVGPSDRRFGLTLGVIAIVGGSTRFALGHPHSMWWVAGGAVLFCLALYRPAILALPNRLWLKLGLLVHKITNPVVMALLFYAVIVPTGVLMRLYGRDPLRLCRDPRSASYWIMREPPGPLPETIRNQF